MRTTAREYLNRKRRKRIYIENAQVGYGALVFAVFLFVVIALALAKDYLEDADKYLIAFLAACLGATCWIWGYVSGRGRE